MDAHQRVEIMLNEAKKIGLINPITGDGMPTMAMIVECINDAEGDAENKATGFDRLIDLADKWEEAAGVELGDGYQYVCGGFRESALQCGTKAEVLKACAAELRKVNNPVSEDAKRHSL